MKANMLRPGATLYGYCGGDFGRDSYGKKRVEAVGHDWVIARDDNDNPLAALQVDPEDFLQYMEPENDD